MATEPREFPGYQGIHVRDQAPGAIPNGSRVRKVASVPADTHEDGALATVLGSLHAPGVGYGYFVEWDVHPRHAVLVAGVRIEAVSDQPAEGAGVTNGVGEPAVAEAATAKVRRQLINRQAGELMGDLRRRFPASFGSPNPLAIGIDRVVQELLPETPPRVLSVAMKMHCLSSVYLWGLKLRLQRVNLDGSISGPVDGEHAKGAEEALRKRAADQALRRMPGRKQPGAAR